MGFTHLSSGVKRFTDNAVKNVFFGDLEWLDVVVTLRPCYIFFLCINFIFISCQSKLAPSLVDVKCE